MSLKKKLKKLRKKLKKTFVFKAAKTVGRTAAKVVKYAAPAAGALVLGPLGAAGGTALAAAASQVGPNKNRKAALVRTLKYGGAVTVGTAALGLVSGAGIGASVLSSGASLFGGGGGSAASGTEGLDDSFIAPTSDQGGSSGLDDAFITTGGKRGQGPQGGNIFGQALDAFGRVAGDQGGDPSPGDPRQGGGFLESVGDFFGGGEEPGFFETEEGKPDLVKIGLVAGAAWYLFLRKKAG